MDLLEETLQMLRADERTREEIAKATGLGKEWLSKLQRGLIRDPGVKKIEKLNTFLKTEAAA